MNLNYFVQNPHPLEEFLSYYYFENIYVLLAAY